MEQKKILILYNKLFHYRIPIFKILADRYELTVAYTEGPSSKIGLNFNIKKLTATRVNRFVIHKGNIFNYCQGFDVVIAYGDIAWLKYSTLPWHSNRRFKIIFWSIGVSASYDKSYDKIKKWDKIRDFFYKKADALVLYTDYPIKEYIKRGFSQNKMFVAPNTVEIIDLPIIGEYKNDILFIGTLYLQKGLLLLLENYKEAYKRNVEIPNLNIVGGGDEFDSINTWIINNELPKKIILHGPVYDPIKKAEFFKKSIACISPDQAGLAVLESMGYGVPFITQKDSITGGERFNIKNGENGILYEEHHQLVDIILDIQKNRNYYLQMGENAKTHYMNCRKPIDMANGLSDAIEYVLNKKE